MYCHGDYYVIAIIYREGLRVLWPGTFCGLNVSWICVSSSPLDNWFQEWKKDWKLSLEPFYILVFCSCDWLAKIILGCVYTKLALTWYHYYIFVLPQGMSHMPLGTQKGTLRTLLLQWLYSLSSPHHHSTASSSMGSQRKPSSWLSSRCHCKSEYIKIILY